eukprot:CAMPEP_0114245322 /NCGR_PEP_ID=MMETSP0058-20121206/11828_1 /TAXON_ID=36894 /ORGANISM="Pyramimonas parkeae, CCMP726" /LENGTH=129 /DNA_ID=CAMNT_0001358355 /DNA_START=60 /DNA_END=449 /DNA_ORIENTATION=+
MAVRDAGARLIPALVRSSRAMYANTRAFGSGALVQPTRSTPPEQSVRPGKDAAVDPSHTQKWLYDTTFAPMDMIANVPPIPVSGNTAVCYGGDNPALGHPAEYIQLNDTSKEAPATCKYCGLRFYELPH